nr:alkaline phosphatase family protein [Ramlibacter agri]
MALLLAALLLAACANLPEAQRPPLVVVFVVDGLPYRQVEQLRGDFAPDGLNRFLKEGAVFDAAHYGHAFTVTAAGHATLLTGVSPSRHGIIGNEWRDPQTGAAVYCASDPQEHYIGHPTRALDGTSPRKLQAETVGDVLRRISPQSRVIAVSGKDRGAILPGGQAGTAYIAMADGRFASSTFYMAAHPAWVDAFQPPAAEGRSAEAQLDAATLAFARAAVAAEQLGRRDAPDLLLVSLSGHDLVNHRWSAESPQSREHLLQLDALLQAFLRELDAAVGRARYVALLTADHGFTPSPEWARAQGLDAGRITGSTMVGRVNAALAARFQADKLVAGTSASALLLDRRLLAAQGLAPDEVAAAAREALLAQPGIAAAYTRQELASGSRAGAPFFAAMQRSWNAGRSGDVQYVTKPFWMFGTAGATHGSPYEEDTHVPLLLWGPAWVRAGHAAQPVDMVDVAPTLANLLRLPPPAASEGRPLPLPH